MTIATEKVAETFLNIQASVACNCIFPLYQEDEVEVIYGYGSLNAVLNTDFQVTLSPPNYNQFTITPTAALLTKINNLIAADEDDIEINYITVRRKLDFLTSTTPSTIGETKYLSVEIDRIHMRLIQLSEKLKRAILFPPKNIGSDDINHFVEEVPIPGNLVAWSPSGTGLVNAVLEGGGTVDLSALLAAIAAADAKAQKALNGIESEAAGYLDHIITPTASVLAEDLTGNLTFVTPQVTALINGFRVIGPSISSSMSANYQRDYYLNADGSWTVENEPLASYPEITRHPDKLKVWTLESNGSAVVRISLMGNLYRAKRRADDKYGTIDRIVELYHIYDVTTPWSAGLNAGTYGMLLETAAGRVYQVVEPGTTGGTAPTGVQNGDEPLPDGTAGLYFYGMKPYLGMFRYGVNNAVEYYFSNLGVHDIVHRTVLQSNPLSVAAGTTLMSLAEKHVKGVYKHLIRTRVNSGTYKFGQKFTQSGFVWRVNTVAGGAVAASTAAYGGAISVGTVVTDGAVQAQAIYAHYSPHNNFWMNVAPDFVTYRYPDSHDSYASTLMSLHCQMMKCGYDLATFLATDSEQPSGSGTYYTYRELMDDMFYDNLTSQITNSLTRTFQADVAPWDGSTYNIQYLEDNCESAKAFRDGAAVYDYLSENTLRDQALADYDTVDLTGIKLMYDVNEKKYATNYGQVVGDWEEFPGWYPYGQAQFFPERCNLRNAHGGIRYDVKESIFDMFPNWINDRSRSYFPDNFIGILAAGEWQDNEKAYVFIENTERYYLADNRLTIGEYAWYLLTKDILIAPYTLLKAESDGITVRKPGGDIEKITW